LASATKWRARPEDRARRVEIARQSALEVHIIYDPAAPDHTAFHREVERMARDDLTWLPATVSLVEFLTIARPAGRGGRAR